jgi:AraC-like DNA-binding protein
VTTTLLESESVSGYAAACPTLEVSGPQEFQGPGSVELCLVRRGCFQYRDSRGVVFVDSVTCLFAGEGRAAEMSHPAPGGDLDTLLFVTPEVLASIGGGSPDAPLSAPVTPVMQLAHRRLLVAARDEPDDLLLEDLILDLVGTAIAQVQPARVAVGRPQSERVHARLVDDARQLLALDPSAATLTGLAQQLSCSPYHLSRLFRARTGTTVSQYRLGLRLNQALEQLMDSGSDDVGTLATVAADCGFSDQAHLTRTMRRHLGVTPDQLRRQFHPNRRNRVPEGRPPRSLM